MFRSRPTTFAAAVALALTASGVQADTIRIGASAPRSGPMAAGAAITHWPNVQLWAHDVNARGGLQVGGERMLVEIVEYDDRSSNEDAIRNIQRLVTQDQVDFLVAPYATGFNIAAAPVIARYGFPQIVATAPTDNVPEFVERWPNSFWVLGTASQLAGGMVSALERLHAAGEIGNRVALVHVSDGFGLELIGAARPGLEAAGFEIVYESSYPTGTQDVAPIISGAIAAEPDAFVAFSYPGETFAFTEQARIQNLDVGAFYVGVGTAFPAFRDRFGANAEGVLGIGGVDTDAPQVVEYFERHREVTGQEPDSAASAYTYASLEILAQAIEAAGTLDRAAVIEEIRSGTFETLVGTITLESNANPHVWTTGQWRDGVFRAVSADGIDTGTEPVRRGPWQ